MFGSSYSYELAQDMINFLSYELSKRDYEIGELLQMLKDEFSGDSYYGNRDISAYSEEVEEAFDAVEIDNFIEWREQQELMESRMRINEFSIGGLLKKGAKSLLGGGLDVLKERIARSILGRLGVDVEGSIGKVLINTIGNFGMDDFEELVSGEGFCEEIVSDLLEGVEETILEKLPEMMGYEPNGIFARIIEEAVINAMVENKEMNKKIARAICEEVDDVISSVNPF